MFKITILANATVFILLLLLFNTSCCATEKKLLLESFSPSIHYLLKGTNSILQIYKNNLLRSLSNEAFFKVTASKAFWGCYTTAYWMEECFNTCTAWQTNGRDVTSLCLMIVPVQNWSRTPDTSQTLLSANVILVADGSQKTNIRQYWCSADIAASLNESLDLKSATLNITLEETVQEYVRQNWKIQSLFNRPNTNGKAGIVL